MRIKRTHRRHRCLRKTDGMDKIRGPYFFDYWPFSAVPRTLWHLVSWCRSLLSCYRAISNGVVMARLSDRPTIRMQIHVARICICTSWFRNRSRPVSGSIHRISGPPRPIRPGHFSARPVDRAPTLARLRPRNSTPFMARYSTNWRE